MITLECSHSGCGKKFSKPSRVRVEQAVRMHTLRAHLNGHASETVPAVQQKVRRKRRCRQVAVDRRSVSVRHRELIEDLLNRVLADVPRLRGNTGGPHRQLLRDVFRRLMIEI